MRPSTNLKTGRRIACSARKALAPHLALLLMTLNLLPQGALPALALETSPAVAVTSSTGINFGDTESGHEAERKQIESLLAEIENSWNAHELDKVMNYYADDYINNDGLDKTAVKEITQDFWKTNPDAKSSSNKNRRKFCHCRISRYCLWNHKDESDARSVIARRTEYSIWRSAVSQKISRQLEDNWRSHRLRVSQSYLRCGKKLKNIFHGARTSQVWQIIFSKN